LAYLETDGVVKLIDLETWEINRQLTTAIQGARYIGWPEANRLIIAGINRIDLLDLETDTSIAHFEDPRLERCTVAATSDGRAIACLVADGSTILLKAGDDEIEEIRSWRLFGPHNGLAISPDGAEVIHGTEDGQAILWNTRTGKGIGRLSARGNLAHFQSLTTSRAATNTDVPKPFYIDNQKPAAHEPIDIFEMTVHSRAVCAVFSPRDPWLLATTIGSDVMLWNSRSGQILRTFRGHEFRILAIAFSPDGKSLASGGFDQRILIWDVDSGRQVATLQTERVITDLKYLPDGTSLLCGQNSNPGRMQIWDLESYRVRKTIITGKFRLRFTLSESQELIATQSPNGGQQPKFWDMTTLREVEVPGILNIPGVEKGHVTFSTDGGFLTHVAFGRDLTLWNLSEQRVEKTIAIEPAFGFRRTAYSPARGEVAVASMRGHVLIVDLDKGEVRKTRPMRHLLRIGSVAYSSDGGTLASAGFEGIVKLWDPKTGELLMRLDQTQVSAAATEPSTDRQEATEPVTETAAIDATDEATANENGQQKDRVPLNSEDTK